MKLIKINQNGRVKMKLGEVKMRLNYGNYFRLKYSKA